MILYRPIGEAELALIEPSEYRSFPPRLLLAYNLQRETILPSERAAAYKMKLEALKHQGHSLIFRPHSLKYLSHLKIAVIGAWVNFRPAICFNYIPAITT